MTNAEATRLTQENLDLREQNARLMTRIEALEGHASNRVAKQEVAQKPLRAVGAAAHIDRSSISIPADLGLPFALPGLDRVDAEAFYQSVKARLIAESPGDPLLLRVLSERPELVVEVERKVVNIQGDTTKGRVGRLMAAGWFADAREVGEVRRELTRTGSDPGGGGALGIMLNYFVKDGFFVREGNGFALAPGVKVSERELAVA